MKMRDLLEAAPHLGLEKTIRDMLWREYQADSFLPASEETPEMMDDEDYFDFEEHVDAIVTFARHNQITDPKIAMGRYEAAIKSQYPSVH